MQRRETKQRETVLNAVCARCDHPTAEQIYQDVRALNARISRGTVYRNLACLSQDGKIRHVKVPGADRYDFRTDPHCHAVCTRCGAVLDVPAAYDAELDRETAEATGFEILLHRTVFEGICPACRNAGGSGS